MATQSSQTEEYYPMVTERELTEKLLDDPTVAEQLRLADSYIGLAQQLGRRFSLPKEHAYLDPIVHKYKNDLPRFIEYVRKMRDTVTPRSNAYISLHELYRTLNIRVIQQGRRDRARRALAWLQHEHPHATTEQKLRWMRRLEQKWGRDRLRAMEDVRRKTKKARLSTSERDEVLMDFWNEVDEEIKKGNLPSL